LIQKTLKPPDYVALSLQTLSAKLGFKESKNMRRKIIKTPYRSKKHTKLYKKYENLARKKMKKSGTNDYS